jgi:hypothetical protein
MRAGFEYYRAIFEDAKQNKEYGKEKLEIPILKIGGEAAIGNSTTTTFQRVANNVTGITLPKAKFSDKTDTRFFQIIPFYICGFW